MHYRDILEEAEPRFKKVILKFREELKKMRTARPSTSLVEDLEVECFGKKVPLKSLGMIRLGEDREIMIKPWDKSYFEPIEKALHESSLDLSPVTGEENIRVPFPTLTDERRERYLKILAEKSEDARIEIREIRNKAKRKIEKAFSEGEITEDEKYRGFDKLQEMVDEYNEKIEEKREEKEDQIKEE